MDTEPSRQQWGWRYRWFDGSFSNKRRSRAESPIGHCHWRLHLRQPRSKADNCWPAQSDWWRPCSCRWGQDAGRPDQRSPGRRLRRWQEISSKSKNWTPFWNGTSTPLQRLWRSPLKKQRGSPRWSEGKPESWAKTEQYSVRWTHESTEPEEKLLIVFYKSFAALLSHMCKRERFWHSSFSNLIDKRAYDSRVIIIELKSCLLSQKATFLRDIKRHSTINQPLVALHSGTFRWDISYFICH